MSWQLTDHKENEYDLWHLKKKKYTNKKLENRSRGD